MVWHVGLHSPDWSDVNVSGYENKHFNLLYKLLTDKNNKTRLIDGKIYELILINTSTNQIIYDIEVNNLIHRDNLNHDSSNVTIADQGGQVVTHSNGWVLDVTAKIYGDIEYDSQQAIVPGVMAAYARFNIINNTISYIFYIIPIISTYDIWVIT